MAIIVYIRDNKKTAGINAGQFYNRYKIGDVVCIVDDSHQFKPEELAENSYGFIDVQGDKEEFSYLLEGGENVAGQKVHKRKYSLPQNILNEVEAVLKKRKRKTKNALRKKNMDKKAGVL